MGRLSAGMARLASRQLEVNGESITYTRGAEALPLTAVRGRTKQPADGTNNRTTVESSDIDFLLPPSELVFGGVVSEPLKGDRITAGTEVYEVWPTVSGEQCWTPSDSYGHLIRAHTRREV